VPHKIYRLENFIIFMYTYDLYCISIIKATGEKLLQYCINVKFLYIQNMFSDNVPQGTNVIK